MNETDRNETEKINRALAEAVGGEGFCWHEIRFRTLEEREWIPGWFGNGRWRYPGLTDHCSKCGERVEGVIGNGKPEAIQHVPDYYNDISACLGNGGLVEWMRREKGVRFEIETRGKLWVVFIYEFSGFDRGANESLPTAIATACHRALGISLETKAEAL